MTPWTEFTRIQKFLSAIAAFIGTVVVLFGFGYASYDHFATKAYADAGDAETVTVVIAAAEEVEEELHTYQQQQVISSNRAEIWRAKREIKRLERERIKPGNNITDLMLIDADIKEYGDLIVCIRDNKGLCY